MLSLMFVALAFTAQAALAQNIPANPAQKIVVAQSDIAFVSKQLGVPVEGHVKKFDASLNINAAKPEASEVTTFKRPEEKKPEEKKPEEKKPEEKKPEEKKAEEKKPEEKKDEDKPAPKKKPKVEDEDLR